MTNAASYEVFDILSASSPTDSRSADWKPGDGLALEIGGMPDHVHLLLGWRRDESLATLMRNVKARSSAWIHREFPNLVKFAWQEGYGAFTVSASQRETVCEYIARQEEHHHKRTFQEEYLELLKRSGVDYDERYLW